MNQQDALTPEQILETATRLDTTTDEIKSKLAAGAISGQRVVLDSMSAIAITDYTSPEWLAEHQARQLASIPASLPVSIPVAWLLQQQFYVKIALLHPDAKIPVYAKVGDSGFDLIALTDIEIAPQSVEKIPLGLAFEFPQGLEIQVRSRSGLSAELVTVANSPGTVDSGYRGEVAVLIHNETPVVYRFDKGDKIAQGVLAPVYKAVFVETAATDLSVTDRGKGGFNSTGA